VARRNGSIGEVDSASRRQVQCSSAKDAIQHASGLALFRSFHSPKGFCISNIVRYDPALTGQSRKSSAQKGIRVFSGQSKIRRN
jgi:hypothetical protein